MSDETTAIAMRLFDALESADSAALRDIYAPGATLWTNTAQRDLDAIEVAAFLPALARRLVERTYANRRVIPFDGGFVHCHRLAGIRKDGARVAAECCAIVHIENGLVVRIDEYLDSRQQDALSST